MKEFLKFTGRVWLSILFVQGITFLLIAIPLLIVAAGAR